MTNEADDWNALARLTGTAVDAAQARMALLRQREAALRATLAGIDAERRARAGTIATDDPAQRAGADLLWHQWVDRRRTALNAELARTLAQIDASRAVLARAHGRHEVTENLARSAQKARRDRRDNKAERGW